MFYGHIKIPYNANNGKINTLYYGGKDENGDARGLAVRYVYDALDRTSEIWYNTGTGGEFETVYAYEYDTSGALYSVTDYSSNEVTMYRYDASGKLLQSYVCDLETYKNRYGTILFYDDQSRVNSQFFSLDCASLSGNSSYMMQYYYSYDDSNAGNLDSLWIDDSYLSIDIDFTYNQLQRLTQKTVNAVNSDGGGFYQSISYDYVRNTSSEKKQSDRISQMISEIRNADSEVVSNTTYKYTYDTNGNITVIRYGSLAIQYRYTYDDLGQLIREDNRALGKSYVYTYDTAGNITSQKEHAFTTGTLGECLNTRTYTYGNSSWGDQLTNFNGSTILYDQIGNPTIIGTYDATEERWSEATGYIWHGRELVAIRYMDCMGDGSVTEGPIHTTYTYNADGIRTSKTVDGIEHRYYLSGSQIIAEEWFNSGWHLLIYIYDESGAPIGLKYRQGTYAYDEFDVFFFEKNLQGDVVAIYNELGEQIGAYFYDAWGNHTVYKFTTNTALENSILNTYNPFRYRGYFYDVETELYYLQTRYYNPVWGRFLNADGYLNANGDILGYNMYA